MCLLIGTESATAQGPLHNGGFERWDAAVTNPLHWTVTTEGKKFHRVTRSDANATEGSSALRIHLPVYETLYLQQYIAVKPGGRYRVGCDVRGAFEGRVALNVEPSGGVELPVSKDWRFDQSWQRVALDVRASEKGYLGIQIRALGKGVLWVDRLRVEELSEDTPSLANPATVQASASARDGDFVLPSLLSDNMVLQRERPISIWGWSPAGKKITVQLGDETKTAVAGTDNKWKAVFKSRRAGGPFSMTIRGDAALTLTNVMIGDVWVCAGQSNMQHPMSQVIDTETEIASANYPNIRLATIPMQIAGTNQEDILHHGWIACDPRTVREFSAVGYYFGRRIHELRKIPIGLIDCSWYGTSIIGWTSHEAYDRHPPIRLIRDKFVAEVKRDYPDWEQQMGKYHGAQGSPFKDSSPAGIYSAMVSPLTKFPIKGVIWYQGESDARRFDEYAEHFPIVIRDWRRAWGQGDFSFLYVQIAYCKWWAEHWAQQCEAQFSGLKLPNTAMVIINDLHDNYDQHPRLKKGVGERLALAARATVYGEKRVVYSGPIYQSLKREGNKLRLFFKPTCGSLVAKDEKALSGFTIAAADRKFRPADARIDGETLLVWHDDIPEPATVRYNWNITNPVCALFNGADLPMSTFRTDDWPLR